MLKNQAFTYLKHCGVQAPEPVVTPFWGKVRTGKIQGGKPYAMTLGQFFTRWQNARLKGPMLTVPTDKEKYKDFKRQSAVCAIFGDFKTQIKDKPWTWQRKDDNLASRSVLVLDFDSVTYDTLARAYSALEAELGYRCYATPSLKGGLETRLHVWIPLDEPITDKALYKKAVEALNSALEAVDFTDKGDKSAGTWSQLESLPLLTQWTVADKVLVKELNPEGPLLSVKKLKEALEMQEILENEPSDTADRQQAQGALSQALEDGDTPVAIVTRWADGHRDWLKEYKNFLSVFFEVGYSEYQAKEISHEEALAIMDTLADSPSQAEENRKKYEQESNIKAFKKLRLGTQRGLSYFIPKSATVGRDWLDYDKNGHAHIDYQKLTTEWLAENPMFLSADYPTHGAFYDGKTHRWYESAWQTALQSRVTKLLMSAGVWSTNTDNSMMKAVQSLAGDPKWAGKRPLDAPSSDPWLVGFENGRCFHPLEGWSREIQPDDYIPNLLPFSPTEEELLEPTPEPTLTINWLSAILGDDLIALDYVLQKIGYLCVREQETAQTIDFWVGEGANGKTTFFNFLAKFLGEQNISHVNPDTMAGNRFACADMYHKLANIGTEVPPKYLEDGTMLKALSGGDQVRAELKFGASFAFNATAKSLFACNALPQIGKLDQGLLRRLHVFNCPLSLKGEKLAEFAQKYPLQKIYEQGPAFILYCIKYFASVYQDDRSLLFKDSKEMKAQLDDWVGEADSVAGFISTYCDFDPDNTKSGESTGTLYRAYELMAQADNQKTVKKQNFKKKLDQLHYHEKKMRGAGGDNRITPRYRGLTLNEAFFDEVDTQRQFADEREDRAWDSLLQTTIGYQDWLAEQNGQANPTSVSQEDDPMDVPF